MVTILSVHNTSRYELLWRSMQSLRRTGRAERYRYGFAVDVTTTTLFRYYNSLLG